MHEQPCDRMRVPLRPHEIPGLICCWDFLGEDPLRASDGEPYRFQVGGGSPEVIDAPGAAWGDRALRIREGDWLRIPRAACPRLDRHGRDGHLTVMAWLWREATAHGGCEFVAGQWNETHLGRQYGLFLNIMVWNSHEQICGHLSNVGGPTPGFRYCIDGAFGATPVERGRWCSVAMSYDGQQGAVWLDGRLDLRPGLNPYAFAGGLHDGGPQGSDFTLGAVHRSGEMGNFFHGRIAALACYERALSAAEMYALARANA